ncbi:hypothetical protein, variant [Saprolegnia diclina VS20]|uniref:Major facilitator superfamily (MFS) profile domain-containing protein n=1 Tax=Saprolegnia diclina (strain VS20) TaxID=1156394 RepID=T0RSC4_SAPDV|nr:hypothetical protein SDRG_09533 [Saprolegnia diclina VS20]XP_008613699.1 hypothetical protein, variant [Saprolegnia diclina VS20]EQC33012.1 hypothetical protein SDRG_09533 [Saprolegnia diclina VS20]EQC33013.1 hypothetical protein, variant [Saprolegnia diclina VS20]|eukprot:XP_008613698.1 hypothetical protein SDRG_09533 [Saprolegnia diclina VS20]
MDAENWARPSDCDDDDECDRESWLYRSTCDANSIARLCAEDLDDDGADAATDSPLGTPTAPFQAAKLKLPVTKGGASDRMDYMDASKRNVGHLREAKPLWKPLVPWTEDVKLEKDDAWIDCMSPNNDECGSRPMVLIEPFAVLSIVVTNISVVAVATFGWTDRLRTALGLQDLPRCSLVLVISMLLSVACSGGGLVGDYARHRGLVLRWASCLWVLASSLLLFGCVLDTALLYGLGLALAYVAAGAVVPNVVVAGTALEHTHDVSDDHERLQITTFYGWTTAATIGSLAATQAFCLATLSETQVLALFALIFLLLLTLAWLHVHMRCRRWPPQVTSVSVVATGWHVVRGHWLLLGTSGGALLMLLGALAVVASLAVPPSSTGAALDTRFLLAAAGVGSIFLGWISTLILGVASFNLNYSVHVHRRRPDSEDNDDEDEDEDADGPIASEHMPVLRGLSLFPIGCMAVFAAALRGQLYSLLLLQQCQTSQIAFGSVLVSPDYVAVGVGTVALVSSPLLLRLLTVELKAFGRSTRLLHALLFYLLSAFLAGIVELYRRSSPHVAGPLLFPNTCHKKVTTSMDAGYATAYVLPLGLAEMLFRTCVSEIGAFVLPPRQMGLAASILAVCDGIGIAAAIGIGVITVRWYRTPGPTDLVLVLLASTTLACMAYACMKRLVAHYQAAQIWL